MKSLVLLLACLCISTSLITGCGPSDEGQAEPITFTLDMKGSDFRIPLRDGQIEGYDQGIADLGETQFTPIPLAGGATTHAVTGEGAFVQPAANLSLRRRGRFEVGLQFFQLLWVPSPNRSEVDGLGPTYNAESCIACHRNNGRGDMPFENASGVLLRLGTRGGDTDPRYGGQLQTLSIPGVNAEGTLIASWGAAIEHQSGQRLTPIEYRIERLAFGALSPGINLSARITPQLVGMGLIDAIPEESLAFLEDPADLDGDGVSGRAARDPSGQLLRFGWKATQRTVLTQCAAAFFNDMGITSGLHPAENCPPSQERCRAAPVNEIDIDEGRLQATADYVALLGVPAHRHRSPSAYHQGLMLFNEVGCAACHHPDFMTGTAQNPELSAQHIWPYSDFLLHDMGELLNDGVAEGDAAPAEWRTPPLWGLGLIPEVNGSLHLMHDGRARSIEEAILWHGGEATQAVSAFSALSTEQRTMLLDFVRAL